MRRERWALTPISSHSRHAYQCAWFRTVAMVFSWLPSSLWYSLSNCPYRAEHIVTLHVTSSESAFQSLCHLANKHWSTGKMEDVHYIQSLPLIRRFCLFFKCSMPRMNAVRIISTCCWLSSWFFPKTIISIEPYMISKWRSWHGKDDFLWRSISSTLSNFSFSGTRNDRSVG